MRGEVWSESEGESRARNTSRVRVRGDKDVKEQAAEALATMGLSGSDAVRLFLRRGVVEQAFPLELKVPNAETRAAMEESRAIMAAHRARFCTEYQSPPCP